MGGEDHKRLKTMLLLIVAVMLLITTSAYAFGLLSRRRISITDGITASVDVGLYKDNLCTRNLTSIDWGTVSPGDNVTFKAYIRNLGDFDIILQIETSNWNPIPTSNYMTLLWDYSGGAIKPNDVVPVVFTLKVSPDIKYIDVFHFDVIITSYS